MITVPILDDGYARIAKAAARLEAAHLASVIVVENVIEEVRLALNQWLQAREQVEAYDIGLVGAARTVVQPVGKRVQGGRGRMPPNCC